MFFKNHLLKIEPGNDSVLTQNFGKKSNNASKEQQLNTSLQDVPTEKDYVFQFVLTDETVRKRITDFITPIRDQWDVINVQFAYCVKEINSNSFFTRIRSGERIDDNTGKLYDTTYLIALTKENSFEISYTVDEHGNEGEVTYDVPKKYEKISKQAIDFWRRLDLHKNFEMEYKAQNKDTSLLALNSKLRAPLFELIPEVKVVEKKHFEVNSLEDAKKLYEICDKSYLYGIQKYYDVETVKAFDQYVDKELLSQWIVEECEEVLYKIIDGDTDKLYKKLSLISGRCHNYLSAPHDLAELYTKACKVLFQKDVYIPLRCIISYLSIYTKRFDPLHAEELLDITENYLKVNFPEEYEKKGGPGEVLELKRLCSELRGMIIELLPNKNKDNYQFVLTKPELLDTIVKWYYDKYNDVEAVKEELYELNCVYGIQNEEVFLTSTSDETDSVYSRKCDWYSFIVVFLDNMEVADFRCKRSNEDGTFSIDYRSSGRISKRELEAAEFFRNKMERTAFFEEYANQNDGEKVYDLKSEAHEALFKGFGASFQNLIERIGDNPLADTLKNFVELCEQMAPEWRFNNVVVNEPVENTQIEQWEKNNGISLPESYRQFLRFANGFRFLSSSEFILGLDEIEISNEYIEPDYMVIGEIIGDGTSLCLSKSTGKAYIEDHGEYECKGDFRELLDYVIEFAYG